MIKTRLCRAGVLSLILLLAVLRTQAQQVTGFTVAASHGTNVLYWEPYTMAQVDHYSIYWSTTQGFSTLTDSITISNPTVNYTHSGLSTSSTYYYRIRAWVNVSGVIYKTLLSSEKSAQPIVQTYFNGSQDDGSGRGYMCTYTLNGYNPLPPPTGLEGAASHQASILTWDTYSDAAVTNYTILWANDTGFTSPGTQAITSGNINWAHTGITAGSNYYYKIAAKYNDGCPTRYSALELVVPVEQTYISGSTDNGAAALRVCYSTLNGTTPYLPPTGFTAAGSHEMNELYWDYTFEFNQYTINWGTSPGALTNSQVITNPTTWYQHTGRTAGQPYYYKITSAYADGCAGSTSAVISATPVTQTYFNGSSDDGSSKQLVCNVLLNGLNYIPAPTNLTVASSHNANILFWDQFPDPLVSQFNVVWSLDPGFGSITTQNIGSSLTNWTQSGLTAGSTYYYKLVALYNDGCMSNYTAAQSSVPVVQTYINGSQDDGSGHAIMCNLMLNGFNTLIPPTNLVAAASQNSSVLYWDSYSDPAVTQYNIMWASDTGFTSPANQLISGGITNWVHSGITAGSSYYYKVTGLYNDGCPSRYTAAQLVTPTDQLYINGSPDDGSGKMRTCYFKLDGGASNVAPTGLMAAGSHLANQIYWDYNPEFSQYTVYWGTSVGSMGSSQNFTPATTISWQQTSLTAAQPYYYKITATFTDGCVGGTSPIISATPVEQTYINGSQNDGSSKLMVCNILLNGTNFIPAPTSFYAASSHNSNVLCWDKFYDPAVTQYNVIWSLDPAFTSPNSQIVSGTLTNWVHTGLTSGTSYYYMIGAYYNDGCPSNYTAAQQVIPVDQVYFNGSQDDGSGKFRACYAALDGSAANVYPTNFTVATSHSANALYWDYAPEFSQYTVSWGTAPGALTNTQSFTPNTSIFWQHTGLTAGQAYYYKVSNTFTDGCPAGTSPVQTTTPQGQTYFDGSQNEGSGMIRTCNFLLSGASSANAPSGLTVASSHNANVMYWDFTPGFSTYAVESSTALAGPFTNLYTTSGNTTTFYTHSNPTLATYYYRITGVMNDGCGAGYSGVVSTTSMGQVYIDGSQNEGSGKISVCTSKLDGSGGTNAPLNFIVAASHNSNIMFWDATPGFTNYTIESSATGLAGSFSLIYTAPNNITTYYNHAVASIAAVYYRLSGTANDGCSVGYSPVINATPVAQTYIDGSTNEGAASQRICPAKLSGTFINNLPLGFTVAASHNLNVMYWDYSPDFNGFTVQASTTFGGTYSTIGTLGATTTFLTHVVASVAVPYFYKITGSTADGCGVAYTVPVSVTAQEQTYINGSTDDGSARMMACNIKLNGVNFIPAPTSFYAANSHNSAVLCWDKFADPLVTQYNVQWSNDAGFSSYTNQAVTGTLTSWIHTSINNGTNYYYKVAAIYNDGCPSTYTPAQAVNPSAQTYFDGSTGEGSVSQRACYAKLDGTAAAIYPTSLTAGGSHVQDNVYWDYSPEFSQYTIYYGTSIGSMGTTQVQSPGTNIFWTHTGLTAGTTYYYKITATFLDGCTAGTSPVVTATPVAQTYIDGSQDDGSGRGVICNLKLNGYNTLVEPTNMIAANSHNSSVLFWDKYPDAAVTQYNVMWANDVVFTSPTTQIVTGGNINWTHSSITNGASYYYMVAARYNDGCPSRYTAPQLVIPTGQAYIDGSQDDGSGKNRSCYFKLGGGASNVAPSGFVAAASHQQNQLFWDYSSEFSGYSVNWGTSLGTMTNNQPVTPNTSISWTHSSLTAAQAYYYKITGTFSDACPAGYSTIAMTTPVDQNYINGSQDDGSGKNKSCYSKVDGSATALAPSGLTVAASHLQNQLYWDYSSEYSSYMIYWGTSSLNMTTTQAFSPGTTTYWTHSSLTAAQPYFYKITGTFTDGCTAGYSSTVSAIPVAQTYVDGSQDDGSGRGYMCTYSLNGFNPLAAVTGFVAASSHNSTAMFWDKYTDAAVTQYNVLWSLDPAFGTSTPQVVGSNQTNWTHSSITSGTNYYYKVAALYNDGCPSVYSAAQTVNPTAQAYIDGSQDDGAGKNRSCYFTLSGGASNVAPTGLMASGSHQANMVFWNYASEFNSYTVYYGTSPGSLSSNQAFSPNTTISWQHTGLTAGQPYYYKITNTFIDGCPGGTSGIVSATPVAQTYIDGSQDDGYGHGVICNLTLNGFNNLVEPTNFTAASSHNSSVMYWDKYADASITQYSILWSNDIGFTSPTNQYTAATNINWTHSGITNGSNYYYKLAAVYSDLCPSRYTTAQLVVPTGQTYIDGSQDDGNGKNRSCYFKLSGFASNVAPGGLVAAGSHQTNEIYWDFASEYSQYTISWGLSQGTMTNTQTFTPTTTFWQHPSLNAAQNYYYKVGGTFADACPVGTSAIVSATPVAQAYIDGSQDDGSSKMTVCNLQLNGNNYVPAPTSFYAATSHNASVLCWDKFYDPAVTQYNVLWSNDPGFSTYNTQLVSGTLTNWTHSSITNGTNYYYKVGALYNDGCLSSYTPAQVVNPAAQTYIDGSQNEGSATQRLCVNYLSGTSGYSGPQGFTVAASHNSNVMYWDWTPNITDYTVTYATDPLNAGTYFSTGSLGASAISWVHSGITPMTYYYRVNATTSDACPNASSSFKAVTDLAQLYIDGSSNEGSGTQRLCNIKLSGVAGNSAPLGFTVASSHNANQMYWDFAAGYSDLTITYATDPLNSGTFVNSASLGANAVSWTHSGTSTTPYYYRVNGTPNDGCPIGSSAFIPCTSVAQTYIDGSTNDGYGIFKICPTTLSGAGGVNAPNNFTVAASHNANVMFWESNSYFNTYAIEYSTAGISGPFSNLTTTANNTTINYIHSIPSIANYYYRITGTANDGCTSNYSPVASANPVAQTYIDGSTAEGSVALKICPVKLSGTAASAIPTGFTAASSHNANVLYWDYSSEFSSFTLQSSATLNGTYATISSPGATTTFYTHAVASPVATTYYKITGVAADACPVSYTAAISAIPQEQTYINGSQDDGSGKFTVCNLKLNGVNYIAAPTSFYAASSHNASVLCWDKFYDPAVTQYNVLWSNDPSFTTPTTQLIGSSLTNWTHSNTITGTGYYYKVSALYNDGCLSSYTPAQLVSPTAQTYIDGGQNEGSTYGYSCFSSSLAGITPLINPAGPLNLCPGQTPTLTSSQGSLYQWYLNNSPISLQTNQTYTLSAAGSYKVQITSPTGCSAQSLPVVANYNGPQPVAQSSDYNTCETLPADFFYNVSAWQPTFQWYYSSNGGSSWTAVPGTSPYTGNTNDSLNINSVTSAMNTYQFRCTATAGTCQITSTGSTLNVNANLWTGTADNHWENAANWPCGVPNAQMDVKIPTAPTGGLFPTVYSRNAASKNLTIDTLASVRVNTNKKLSINGNLINKGNLQNFGYTDISGSVINTATINSSDTLMVHGFMTNKDSLVTSGLTVIDSTVDNQAGALIAVTDTLSTTGDWNNQGTVNITGALNVQKNWDGNGTYNFSGSLYFTGNPPSVVDGADFTAHSVHINKGNSAIAVTLNNQLTVIDTMFLNTGVVLVNNPGAPLVFGQNAVAQGVSDNSFVSGPVKKLGDGQPFIFPTGDITSGVWAPIGLSGFASGDAFTAEYFFNAAPQDPNQRDFTLDSISSREYWTLDRSGTSVPWVTLYWNDSARSNIPDVGALQIAHWDGSKWKNQGGTGFGSYNGYITNSVPFTSYSPLTFGYNFSSPLPIKLLSFTASCNNGQVTADWATATETNNDYFTLERSPDMTSWESVAKVAGAGNSNTTRNYSASCSNPYSETTYYRLKQTDFDGQFTYSSVVAIDCKSEEWIGTSVYPNPAEDYIFFDIALPTAEKVVLKVYNVVGQEVFAKEMVVDGKQTYYISLNGFAAGNYKYSVVSKTQMFNGQFIKVSDVR
ncbi:MAG: T9SS type A sorting domain-containing protein [Bacteroidota bacterium]